VTIIHSTCKKKQGPVCEHALRAELVKEMTANHAPAAVAEGAATEGAHELVQAWSRAEVEGATGGGGHVREHVQGHYHEHDHEHGPEHQNQGRFAVGAWTGQHLAHSVALK